MERKLGSHILDSNRYNLLYILYSMKPPLLYFAATLLSPCDSRGLAGSVGWSPPPDKPPGEPVFRFPTIHRCTVHPGALGRVMEVEGDFSETHGPFGTLAA